MCFVPMSRAVKRYTGHKNLQYALNPSFAVSQGGHVVCGSEDDCIYLWDLKTQDIVQRIEGHKGADRAAIHSPLRDHVCTSL